MSYWYFSGVVQFLRSRHFAVVRDKFTVTLSRRILIVSLLVKCQGSFESAAVVVLQFGRRDTKEHDWFVDEELLLEDDCWLVIETASVEFLLSKSPWLDLQQWHFAQIPCLTNCTAEDDTCHPWWRLDCHDVWTKESRSKSVINAGEASFLWVVVSYLGMIELSPWNRGCRRLSDQSLKRHQFC